MGAPLDVPTALCASVTIFPALQLAGGKCKFVPLKPDDKGGFSFDLEEFKAAISDSTKAVVLNTPHVSSERLQFACPTIA